MRNYSAVAATAGAADTHTLAKRGR